MINIYTFEFTDDYVLVYDKKKKSFYKEDIAKDIIKNNEIYDYSKLVLVVKNIVNKYHIINNIFKIKIILLLYESKAPSQIYLFKLLFRNISNIDLKIVNVKSYFNDKNYIFVSGKYYYYDKEKIKNNINVKYVLIGYFEDFNSKKEELENVYNVKVYKLENYKTIIYDNVNF